MKIKNEFIDPKIEKLEPENDIKRPIQFQFQSAIPMHAWICMQTESVFNRMVFSRHTFTSTQWIKGGKESGQIERLTKNAIGVFHISKNPSRTQLISVFVFGYACAVRSVLISNQFVDSLFLFRASASLCSVLLFWYVWASGFFVSIAIDIVRFEISSSPLSVYILCASWLFSFCRSLSSSSQNNFSFLFTVVKVWAKPNGFGLSAAIDTNVVLFWVFACTLNSLWYFSPNCRFDLWLNAWISTPFRWMPFNALRFADHSSRIYSRIKIALYHIRTQWEFQHPQLRFGIVIVIWFCQWFYILWLKRGTTICQAANQPAIHLLAGSAFASALIPCFLRSHIN